MPQVLDTSKAQTSPPNQAEIYYPPGTAEEEIVYPEQREDDMGETSFHYKLIADLMQMLQMYFREREDIFLTANMNLYYVKGSTNKWFAPDILVAFGVPNHDRRVYKLWEENVFPQVVFEIASDRTWRNDVDDKLKLYEQLGAEEYYILDSEHGKYLSAPMLAFHRQEESLLTASVNGDRIFSPRLGLEIVRAENSFRLFNPNTNEFLRTLEEAESELERLKAEIERLKAQK